MVDEQKKRYLGKPSLTVTDGFKFGCGFFLAGFLAYIAIMGITLLVFTSLIMPIFEPMAQFGPIGP